jgi:hypothetical protein
LQKIVVDKLLKNNQKFSDSTATAAWMYSQQAPTEIQNILANYQKNYGVDQTGFFNAVANWPAWVEEITCDLIGLATFGPSFVAALYQLLYSLVSSGTGFSGAHPPVGCRVNIMLASARVLGYDKLEVVDKDIQVLIDDFWIQNNNQKKTDPWFDIFSDQELLETLTEIKALLAPHPPSEYLSPDPVQFEKLMRRILNKIPPIDCEIQSDGQPTCSAVDFRHVLYAGWVASKNPNNTSFLETNRLCEHAIMQLGAINTFTRTA